MYTCQKVYIFHISRWLSKTFPLFFGIWAKPNL